VRRASAHSLLKPAISASTRWDTRPSAAQGRHRQLDCEVTTVVPCQCPKPYGVNRRPPSTIDDLEDGNLQILAREGRQGSWSAYDDQTQGATRTNVEMRPSGRAGSEFAACISGSGLYELGGGMG